MTSASWLNESVHSLLDLLKGSTAPILVQGHQPRGLLELVLEVVAAQLCEQPLGASSSTSPQACGQCPACQMRIGGNHPDFQFLVPQTVGLELGLPVEVKASTKPSQDIRIDDVRKLQSYFTTASSRGGARFVVVYPFEAMNLNTANALLKTLEEPANGLRFVLVGSRVDQLLPTIRSRCQVLTVQTPHSESCLKWLASSGVDSPELAFSLSMNDPFEALNQAKTQPEVLELRKKFVEWLANPEQHGQPPTGLEKVGLPAMLELAQRLCNDAARVRLGHKPANFPWLAPRLMWVRKLELANLGRLYAVLQAENRLAHHPINPRLALEYIGQQWQTLSA